MKIHFMALLVLLSSIIGCSNPSGDIDPVNLIIEGERVGPYFVGQSKKSAILGENAEAKREEFIEDGLTFTFDQNDILNGITVISFDYQTTHGHTIGDDLEQVKASYGEPLSEELLNANQETIPGLVYDGIVFLEYHGKVAAIIVVEEQGVPKTPTPSRNL